MGIETTKTILLSHIPVHLANKYKTIFIIFFIESSNLKSKIAYVY